MAERVSGKTVTGKKDTFTLTGRRGPRGTKVTPFPVKTELFHSHLVVPPQQRDVSGILEFQAQKEAESLDRVVAPVDKVPQKDVRGLGRPPPHLEEIQEVEELAVQVPDYSHGAEDRLDVGLLNQQLTHVLAQLPEGPFRHALALPESLDALVDVEEHPRFQRRGMCVCMCVCVCHRYTTTNVSMDDCPRTITS